jgi:long-subunit fatty acid transport protein
MTILHKPGNTGDIKLYRPVIKTFLYLIVSLITVIGFNPASSHATFLEQMAISTKAISMANAVTADPPPMMALHYNPAGLSLLGDGKRFVQGFTFPYLKIAHVFEADPEFKGFFGQWGPQEGQEHDPLAGTKDTNSSGRMYLPIYNDSINFLLGPHVGLSHREPGSKWTFAIGNYAPFAAGFNHKSDSPVRFDGRSEVLQHLIYAAPGMSYQMTDTLALGMSVGAGLTAMQLRLNMRSPNELVALTRVLGDATEGLDIPILSQLTLPAPWFGGGIGPFEQIATLDFQVRDDFVPNYNLGLLWKPKKWFSFGLTYQSEIIAHMSGYYNFNYEDNWRRMMDWQGSSPLLLMVSGMFQLPTAGVPYQSGVVTGTQKFPQRIQSGISVKPTKRLKVNFDLSWAQWSIIEQDNFQFDQDIQMFQLTKMLGYAGGHRNMIVARNLEDTLHWSAGLEYQLSRKVALRCGYEFRPTSVQDELYDCLYSIPDLHVIGLGAGLRMPYGIFIDVGLSWSFNRSHMTRSNESINMNSTDFFYPVYNPYAGLDVEQKTDIWMLSVSLRMPFHAFIEHQKEMMHKQHSALVKLGLLLKKPFGFLLKKPAKIEPVAPADENLTSPADEKAITKDK